MIKHFFKTLLCLYNTILFSFSLYAQEFKTLDSAIKSSCYYYEDLSKYIKPENRVEYWNLIKKYFSLQKKYFDLKKIHVDLQINQIERRQVIDNIAIAKSFILFFSEHKEEIQSAPKELRTAGSLAANSIIELKNIVNEDREYLDLIIQIINEFIEKINQEYLI